MDSRQTHCSQLVKFAFLINLLGLVTVATAGTSLTPEQRQDIVSHGVATCVAQQERDSLARELTQEQLQEYCQCAMNRTVDSLSVEDLGRFLQSKDMDVLRPFVQKASESCTAELGPKWGYPQ
ncbi:hypothetical protein AB3X91_37915 [Paraburkholderia sp. BR14263]